jgi:hypothetical protein
MRLRACYLGRRPSLGVTPPTAPPSGMTSGPALTGPACRTPGRTAGQHPRRHRPVIPVPSQLRPLRRTASPEAGTATPAPTTSNTPPDRQPRRPGSCYFYCMISPIRGDLTGFVLKPPLGHMGLKSLETWAPGFGGCLRARPRHRARAPHDPRAGNAVTSTWRECRHDHLDTAPLNQLGQGNDAQRPGSSNPAPHRPRHPDRQCD